MRLLIAFLAVFLDACAPMRYYHVTKGEADFARDKFECSTLAIQSSNISNSYIMNSQFAQSQFDQCMEYRYGWRK